MNLTYNLLKTKYFPELNEKVIGKERIIEVLASCGIPVFDIPMEGAGAYVIDASDGLEYVFIKYNLENLLYHETLAYESTHALCHAPAVFLSRRHNLQSEIFSLIMMIPKTELSYLNKIKHQLEPDAYERLHKRNLINAMWKY